MCDSVDIALAGFSDNKYGLQQLNNINEKLAVLGQEVYLAQKSFKDSIFETTACIYCLKLKMVQCTTKAINFKNEKSDDLKKLLTTSTNESEEIEELQEKLKTIISKKSLSIKRSLMKLSNLLGQHELTCLPYYELMAYSNQILENQKSYASKRDKPLSEKLSYSKALRHLEQILEDVEKVEVKTLYLVENRDNSYLVDDPCSFSDDEYKGCPRFSAANHKSNQIITN